MAFDPRCVAFQGRLHADRRTAEYVGRATHDADAACFRSALPATSSSRSPGLRVFYFETQIMATTNSDLESDVINSRPARINTTSLVNRHAARDQDAAATIARDWRRRAEVEAMDLEDVELPSINNGQEQEPVEFNFSLTPNTIQHLRSRMDRRRLRRSSERKKYNHKIAVGFLVDEPIATSDDQKGPNSRSEGLIEARMSRQAVKQLMQRILTVTASNDSEEEDGEENRPAILHRDLGQAVNSLAYVGKTGCVVSHGREFLQCERYGAGDVVGCGVLLDTNTFFFTLNGKIMGVLPAREVYDLEDFGEIADVDNSDESDEDEEDDDGTGVTIQVDNGYDVDMEKKETREEEEKALYPSVSLHGAGECVQAVFQPSEFKFDLVGFEKQILKERQRALISEREKRCENGVRGSEQSDDKDEAAMNALVQDFFLHYGYEDTYKAFESAIAPSKRARFASDSMDVGHGDVTEASTVPLGVSFVDNMEDEEKTEAVESGDVVYTSTQRLRDSLNLRHRVCEHIRRFRTAQVLEVLEQHVTENEMGTKTWRLRRLLMSCRILCVIDILTQESETKVADSLSMNGASHSNSLVEIQHNGWNPEPAIELAQQILGSSFDTSNGKRKRHKTSNERTSDVVLVMSLLLYDKRENVPATSHAQKFLTLEFRESVADEINSFLLATDASANSPTRVSTLETFIGDLENLQKECLRQNCRVYPEINRKWKLTPRRRQASVSSSSDDSSSSQSQSEQEDRLEDEEE